MRDMESRDLAGAAHFAAADAEPEPPPDPSEYEDLNELKWPCPTCGDRLATINQRCPRCTASIEEDRLNRGE